MNNRLSAFFSGPSMRWLTPLLLGITIALFYRGAMSNGTALDDPMVLVSNTFVKNGIYGIPDILSHDSFYGATKRPASKLGWRYRPLSLVCFAVIHEFFGNDWKAYHFFNLFIYFLCCWAIFVFLKRWVFNSVPLTALVASLYFVMMPVHVEVVANIKSADELLACLFSVLFLDRLLRWNDGGQKYLLVGACVCLLAALLSKESSVLLVGIAPLFLYVFSERSIPSVLRASVPFFLLTAGFITLRLLISVAPEGTRDLANDPYLLASLHQKLATISVVFFEYLRLIFFPKALIFDYGYRHIPYVTFADSLSLFSAVLHLVALAVSIRAVLKRDVAGALFLSYFIGILSLSNLLMDVGPVMADRFAFFPGFFLVTAVLLVIARILRRFRSGSEPVIMMFLLVATAPFSYAKTTERVPEWKDNPTLYRADLKKAPQSFRVVAFNAMEEIGIAENMKDSVERSEKFRYGIRLMQQAYAINPDYKNMYKEWGFAYFSLGDIDSAAWAWERLQLLFPNSQYNELNGRLIRDARFNRQLDLYNIRYRFNDYRELSTILRKALSYRPNDSPTWCILGKVYFLGGDRDSAVYAWNEALLFDSTNAEARGLLQLSK